MGVLRVETDSKSNGAPGQGQPLPGKASKPFDIPRFLFLRTVYIALFGTILFLPALPLVIAKMYTVYQVSGRIQFEREPLSAMGAAPSQSISYYFQDYVRTQTKLIKEHTFLMGALSKLPRREWPTVLLPHTNNLAAAATMLSGRLEVNFDNGTQFMTLKMDALSSNGVAAAMNAVMDAFVERKIHEQFATTELNMAYVKEQRDKIQEDIDREQRVVDEASKIAGTSSFVEENNVWRNAYQATQNEWSKAQVNSIEKGWRLASESNRISSVKALPIQSLADQMTASDQSLWGVTLWTYQTLQDLRKSVDGVAVSNPDRRYTDERMKALDDFAKTFRTDVEKRNLRIIVDKRDYELSSALIAAESEESAARMDERDLRLLADSVKQKMIETSGALWQGRSAEQRLDRLHTQRDIFVDRLRVLEAERNSAPRVSVAVYAVPPAVGDVKFPQKMLMLLFALTYGAIAGMYGAYDLLDNRIRSSKDVQAALGAEIVKPIWLVPPPVRYFGILNAYPVHPVSSALRSLAYRLEREHRINGAHVFLFTGIGRQAGVTDTLLNVAVTLRRMSLKVAVLEMNLAAPVCAKRYGVPDGDFVPVNRFLWNGQESLDTCRIEGRNGLPDLYAATQAKDGQPVAGRPILDLFETLHQQYDVILIDTEPILHSEFTVFIAQQADAAVLLVREDEGLYRELRMAMRLVANAGVGSMTAVLNFDVARNPIGNLFGQIQSFIGVTSLSVRLFREQRKAFRENVAVVDEKRMYMPLVRWHVREFGARWGKEVERVIRR